LLNAGGLHYGHFVSTDFTPDSSGLQGPAQHVSKRCGDQPAGKKRRNARKGCKAVIIDDSVTGVAALRDILVSVGFTVRDAADAEKGLSLVNEEVPDLIFLELVLPKRNGFSALRAIRKNEATHNVPVIMITGSENAAEQFFANRIGADDFMKKPFSRSEVFARVEALLDSDRVPRRKVVLASIPGQSDPR
jgi:DNA-binding response OmpR family regulator